VTIWSTEGKVLEYLLRWWESIVRSECCSINYQVVAVCDVCLRADRSLVMLSSDERCSTDTDTGISSLRLSVSSYIFLSSTERTFLMLYRVTGMMKPLHSTLCHLTACRARTLVNVTFKFELAKLNVISISMLHYFVVLLNFVICLYNHFQFISFIKWQLSNWQLNITLVTSDNVYISCLSCSLHTCILCLVSIIEIAI